MGYIYVATGSKLSSWGLQNNLGSELVEVGFSECPPKEIVSNLNEKDSNDWVLLGSVKTSSPQKTEKEVSKLLSKCSDWISMKGCSSYRGLKNPDMIFKMGKSNFLSLLNKRDEATYELLKSVSSR